MYQYTTAIVKIKYYKDYNVLLTSHDNVMYYIIFSCCNTDWKLWCCVLKWTKWSKYFTIINNISYYSPARMHMCI